jgi:hypothetical protein
LTSTASTVGVYQYRDVLGTMFKLISDNWEPGEARDIAARIRDCFGWCAIQTLEQDAVG